MRNAEASMRYLRGLSQTTGADGVRLVVRTQACGNPRLRRLLLQATSDIEAAEGPLRATDFASIVYLLADEFRGRCGAGESFRPTVMRANSKTGRACYTWHGPVWQGASGLESRDDRTFSCRRGTLKMPQDVRAVFPFFRSSAPGARRAQLPCGIFFVGFADYGDGRIVRNLEKDCSCNRRTRKWSAAAGNYLSLPRTPGRDKQGNRGHFANHSRRWGRVS